MTTSLSLKRRRGVGRVLVGNEVTSSLPAAKSKTDHPTHPRGLRFSERENEGDYPGKYQIQIFSVLAWAYVSGAPIIFPIAAVFQTTSVYFCVGAAVDCFIMVVLPQSVRLLYCTPRYSNPVIYPRNYLQKGENHLLYNDGQLYPLQYSAFLRVG